MAYDRISVCENYVCAGLYKKAEKLIIADIVRDVISTDLEQENVT